MSQYDFGTIDPDTMSGPALATALGSWRTALNSAHSGTSRPAYAVAGTVWRDTTTTPWIVKMYDGADDITLGTVNASTNWSSIGAPPRGQLFGLTLSNNVGDATNDIDIAAGEAASDGVTPVLMLLAASITKQLDVAWAVGTNTGMRATGVAIANATYHIFLIRRPDTGVVDVAADTSATGANIAANTNAAYTQIRRIGSIVRASAAIVAFTQIGDEFLLSVPARDINLSGTFGTTAALVTLSAPTGIKIGAIVDGAAQKGAAALFSLITSPDQADTAPVTGGPYTMFSATGAYGYFSGTYRTNTSAQIRVRCDTAASSLFGNTRGWIDTRGQVS